MLNSNPEHKSSQLGYSYTLYHVVPKVQTFPQMFKKSIYRTEKELLYDEICSMYLYAMCFPNDEDEKLGRMKKTIKVCNTPCKSGDSCSRKKIFK